MCRSEAPDPHALCPPCPRLPQRDKRMQLSWACEEQLFRQELENSDDIRLSVRLYTRCIREKRRYCADVAPGAWPPATHSRTAVREAGRGCKRGCAEGCRSGRHAQTAAVLGIAGCVCLLIVCLLIPSPTVCPPAGASRVKDCLEAHRTDEGACAPGAGPQASVARQWRAGQGFS